MPARKPCSNFLSDPRWQGNENCTASKKAEMRNPRVHFRFLCNVAEMVVLKFIFICVTGGRLLCQDWGSSG